MATLGGKRNESDGSSFGAVWKLEADNNQNTVESDAGIRNAIA